MLSNDDATKKSLERLKAAEYKTLDEGSFNQAYLSHTTPPLVLKQAKNSWSLTDETDRAARVYMEITGKAAHVITHNRLGKIWVSEYYLIPTDRKDEIAIAQALVKIYKNTRRIIVDGASYKNWKKNKKNEVICIDPGQAVKRSHSMASMKFWRTQIGEIKKYWTDINEREPEDREKSISSNISIVALNIILNLKYLEDHLSTDTEIKDDYIEYNIIASLTELRERKAKINENFLKIWKDIPAIAPELITSDNAVSLFYLPPLQNLIPYLDFSKTQLNDILKKSSSMSIHILFEALDNAMQTSDFNEFFRLLDHYETLSEQIFPYLKLLPKLNLNTPQIIKAILKDHKLQAAMEWFFQKFSSLPLNPITIDQKHVSGEQMILKAYREFKKGDERAGYKTLFTLNVLPQSLQKAIETVTDYHALGVFCEPSAHVKKQVDECINKLLKNPSEEAIISTMQEWLATNPPSFTTRSPVAYVYQSGLLGTYPTLKFFSTTTLSERETALEKMLVYRPAKK